MVAQKIIATHVAQLPSSICCTRMNGAFDLFYLRRGLSYVLKTNLNGNSPTSCYLQAFLQQECIPVGCVPPAAVVVRGGLPQCMLEYTYPLGVGLETPSGCGPGEPPPQVWAWRLLLGVGLETPPGQTPQLPPLVWAWKLARHAGISPPPRTCCKACWDTTCNACWDTTPVWTDRHV